MNLGAIHKSRARRPTIHGSPKKHDKARGMVHGSSKKHVLYQNLEKLKISHKSTPFFTVSFSFPIRYFLQNFLLFSKWAQKDSEKVMRLMETFWYNYSCCNTECNAIFRPFWAMFIQISMKFNEYLTPMVQQKSTCLGKLAPEFRHGSAKKHGKARDTIHGPKIQIFRARDLWMAPFGVGILQKVFWSNTKKNYFPNTNPMGLYLEPKVRGQKPIFRIEPLGLFGK